MFYEAIKKAAINYDKQLSLKKEKSSLKYYKKDKRFGHNCVNV